jgi:lipoate-protein ligase A
MFLLTSPKTDSDKSLSSNGEKRVRFSKTSKVVLIPSRLEYYAANIHQELWFSAEDFKETLSTALLEVEKRMNQEDITGALTIEELKDVHMNAGSCYTSSHKARSDSLESHYD